MMLTFDTNRNIRLNHITMIHAAMKGQTEIVKELLDNGAVIDVATGEGITPLMFAAGYGSKDTVNILLSNGAPVNARTDYGLTALKLAEKRNHPEIVKAIQAQISSNSQMIQFTY